MKSLIKNYLHFPFWIAVVAVITSFPVAAGNTASPAQVRIREIQRQIIDDPENIDRADLRFLLNTARPRQDLHPKNVAAMCAVSEYYFAQNELSKVLKALEEYSEYNEVNLTELRAPLFLTYARALAADGQLREALKRVDYARDKTEGIPHVRAVAMRGTLALDTGNYAEAVKQYKAAIGYGSRYYKPKRVSSTAAAEHVPGADRWKPIHADLKHLLKTVQRRRDTDRYGEGFVYWRLARTHHLAGRFEDALRVYGIIDGMFKDTVYAEGARFHTADCLFRLGRHAEGVKHLEDFVRDNPYGLWRGEALFDLGEKYLTEKYDIRHAAEYVAKAVEWTGTVRRRDRDIELYMLPEKAGGVTKPPAAPLQKSSVYKGFEIGELVSATVKPEMVTNRETAEWYLNHLASESLYYLGFTETVDNNWDAAMKHWMRALSFSPQRQKLVRAGYGALHDRLKICHRNQHYFVRPDQMRAYEGYQNRRPRTKIMLADFYALACRWKKAETLYRELIDSESTDADQKAVAAYCLSEALCNQGRQDAARALIAPFFEKNPDGPTGPAGYKLLYMMGELSQDDFETAYKCYRRAAEVAPKEVDIGRALTQATWVAQKYHHWEKARESIRLMDEQCNVFPYDRWAESDMEETDEMEAAFKARREQKRANKEDESGDNETE